MENCVRRLSLFLFLTLGSYANAGLIVGYAPAVEVTTGMTASGILSLGSNATVQENTGSFGDNITVRPSVAGSTFNDAIVNDDFFQFSLGSLSTNYFDLQSLAFHAYNGGMSTPRGWVLRSNLDGYASDIDSAFITATLNDVAPELFSVDLSSFTGLSAVDFRIYAFAPTAGFAVNFGNIRVYGAVYDEFGNEIAGQVPAPATVALMTLGLLGLRFRRSAN